MFILYKNIPIVKQVTFTHSLINNIVIFFLNFQQSSFKVINRIQVNLIDEIEAASKYSPTVLA